MGVRSASANGRGAVTGSARTVITFTDVIKLIHRGYRCPNPEGPAPRDLLEPLAPLGVGIPGEKCSLCLTPSDSLLQVVSDVKEDRKSARAGPRRIEDHPLH
jgi:hypothetical protein